jgi:transcriptional regulator of acetoin/glycerol metabolism
MPMEALERDAIIADLGIARSSLYRKIHSYGIGEVTQGR